MSDNVTFRSAFNGFNRSDVINYITELVESNEDNERKIEELERRLKETSEELEELKRTKPEAPKEYIETDIDKKNEAAIGATILAAQRFSDKLVNEANEKSIEILSSASAEARLTAEKAQAVYDTIQKTADECMDGFEELCNMMTGMLNSLKNFSEQMNGETKTEPIVPEKVVEKPIQVSRPVVETPKEPVVEKKEHKEEAKHKENDWHSSVTDAIFDPNFSFMDSDDGFSINIE